MAAPQRSSIRVLVADSDLARRDAICAAVRNVPGFRVAAAGETVEEWAHSVGNDAPELVICRAAFALQHCSGEQLFPLYITIGNAPGFLPQIAGILSEPIVESKVRAVLSDATVRVLTAKAGELSTLISHYVLHRDHGPAPAQLFPVEQDGRTVELPLDEVRWIRAAGNYVTVFADSGVFHVRESIRKVAIRLAPAGFFRIHRGTVVNAMAIRGRVLENGIPVAVVLADGRRLRVGPNFRHQVSTEFPVVPSVTVT